MNRHYIDVLAQVRAATKAPDGVALELLTEQRMHCATQAVAQGGAVVEDKLAEASSALARLLKS